MRVFDLRNAVYYRGDKDSPEIIEVPVITPRREPVTTCVIHVALLEAGVKKYPCGDGDDVKFTDSQLIALMELADEKRTALRGTGRKTLDGWRKSGLPTVEDYILPGDEVDDDMVDYFRDILPPICDRSSLLQAGGTYSTEQDGTGRWRPTFITFSRSDTGWRYNGLCFPGETVNRVAYQSPLQRKKAALEAALVARGGIAPAT